jgi:hypothetical protein
MKLYFLCNFVYLFSWTVSGYSTNYIVTELIVEQNTISSAGEDNGKTK